jgi:hypothetical protein
VTIAENGMDGTPVYGGKEGHMLNSDVSFTPHASQSDAHEEALVQPCHIALNRYDGELSER